MAIESDGRHHVFEIHRVPRHTDIKDTFNIDQLPFLFLSVSRCAAISFLLYIQFRDTNLLLEYIKSFVKGVASIGMIESISISIWWRGKKKGKEESVIITVKLKRRGSGRALTGLWCRVPTRKGHLGCRHNFLWRFNIYLTNAGIRVKSWFLNTAIGIVQSMAFAVLPSSKCGNNRRFFTYYLNKRLMRVYGFDTKEVVRFPTDRSSHLITLKMSH